MLGQLVSSMSQRMIRFATTTLMLSGAGLAGYSYYLDQQAAATGTTGYLAFFREHATWFIALGVAGLVLGFVINAVSMRRQARRMMAGMGMDGAGAMPDISRLMAMQGLAGVPAAAAPATAEVVKVRCRACSSLQAESAAFCSTCGKPLG